MQKMILCHGFCPVLLGEFPLPGDPRFSCLIRVHFVPHNDLFDPLGRV